MISPEDCFGCRVANEKAEPVGGFIYADEHWTVNHKMPPASLLGWLILQPRRHFEALHELTPLEQQEMMRLATALDKCLFHLLSPAKVYLCLFAESPNCPHVHFHIIPRPVGLNVVGPQIFGYISGKPVPLEDIEKFVHLLQDTLPEYL